MVIIEMLITLSSYWLATRQPEYSASSILLATQVNFINIEKEEGYLHFLQNEESDQICLQGFLCTL
jgi:hypothetical protein